MKTDFTQLNLSAFSIRVDVKVNLKAITLGKVVVEWWKTAQELSLDAECVHHISKLACDTMSNP